MKSALMHSFCLFFVLLWTTAAYVSLGQAQNNLPQQSAALAKKYTTKDTLFSQPYVDRDEWRDKPVRHHYVHGGFKGTNTRFSVYFPQKEAYKGHFFQYITPTPDNENLSQGRTGEEDMISFSVSHGAYFVETNGGGAQNMPSVGGRSDATIGAYRANAAAAQFSKTVASQLYGKHRTYGYCYGGSGGAYRTLGGLENTDGVWDGAVPYVLGSPMAIPNVFTVRIHAMQVLHDKFPQIADAMEPGGGDMYAGLNDEERQALSEVTKMGFPPKAWFAYKTMGLHAFPVLYPGVAMADPTYFTDFWKLPGYLGVNPPAYLVKARIQKTGKIKAFLSAEEGAKFGLANTAGTEAERGTADAAWKHIKGGDVTKPIAIQFETYLTNDFFLGGDLLIKTGAAAGQKLFITDIKDDKVVFGYADAQILANMKVGDEVTVDNSNFLAAETYHRHQVPGKEYTVWNQFRDADGKPMYPQRPMLVGPIFTQMASGVLPTGKFKGKVILSGSLWDSEAYPWQQDWYRSRVKEYLGDSLDNHFRIWYTDHANHGDSKDPKNPGHLVSYLGVLHQALLDISAWVEKGVAPPPSTHYKVVDGQVILPATAAERKGIQPVVTLQVNGSERADAKVGKPVTITADIEVPPNAGKIVAAEWDFEDAGTFSIKEKITPTAKTVAHTVLKTTHTFSKPGTYFPTLRVSSQRQGDAKTTFTQIKNLGRVRVVVN